MKNIPLVSVLIPVYNREETIESCIQSALDQTYKNIEIVVVDNNSTDSTLEKCENLAKIDSRIKIFINEENIGPVKNWKKSIDLAQGEYGKILFSDDLILPEFIKKSITLLHNDVSFVISSAKIGPNLNSSSVNYNFSQNPNDHPFNISSDKYINDILLGYGSLVSPGAALFRISDLKDSFMIEIPSPTLTNFSRHGAGPDLLLFLLTAIKYKFVAHIPEPLVFFREHQGSTTIRASTDKSWSIRACYTQARVWFAEYYLDKKILSMLIARAYLIVIITEKKYDYLFRPTLFAKNYIHDLTKFSIGIFLTSLPRLVMSALKYKYKSIGK